MSQLGQKRKLNSTPITKKYAILKEIDKGKSLSSVALESFTKYLSITRTN